MKVGEWIKIELLGAILENRIRAPYLVIKTELRSKNAEWITVMGTDARPWKAFPAEWAQGWEVIQLAERKGDKNGIPTH